MSLADEVEAGPPVKEARKTRLDVWLGKLGEDDRVSAEAVLDDPEWSNVEIAALYRRYGFETGPSRISEWRKARRDGTR